MDITDLLDSYSTRYRLEVESSNTISLSSEQIIDICDLLDRAKIHIKDHRVLVDIVTI